ncbi:MAG TPA: pyridoxamine 5'-phosphate oxidase [Pyrinomonadaceae bacterium]|nr:pyridoxamine 5'-phosphate oxidase [Acidobacteriota bacterium]HQZ95942.1 pyridoxamine 5'-phosphate oxidase [Pyrinomonadaceae bacterium]
MENKDLAHIRRDYSREGLSEEQVANDPFVQFGRWMDEAITAELPEPTAMSLSTASAEGRPSSRMVLLKGFDNSGFVFYTNYNSQKGRELADNPFAALTFFWPELERQVRITGLVSKVSAEESDEYFKSRPFTSRVGAWASNQSETIDSKMTVAAKAAKLLVKYASGNVPRPPHWGGYRVIPDQIEFWQGRPSRLHDRIVYKLDGESWNIIRLSP